MASRKLDTYRAKRNFSLTADPSGHAKAVASPRPRFVKGTPARALASRELERGKRGAESSRPLLPAIEKLTRGDRRAISARIPRPAAARQSLTERRME